MTHKKHDDLDLDHLLTPYDDYVNELDGLQNTLNDSPPPAGHQIESRPYVDNPGGIDDQSPGDNIVIHVVPGDSKSRWSHIDDLDSFFCQVYKYHQKRGFKVMMIWEFGELLKIIFVAFLTVFLFECVDYPILFRDKPLQDTENRTTNKVLISDVIIPMGQCMAKFSFMTWVGILMAAAFWTSKIVALFYHIFQYWEIKAFYNSALKIEDFDLDSITWQQVQTKLIDAQTKHMMCIHKESLTQLDIYHRILRYKNYMVAMISKGIIPIELNLPFIGEIVYFSEGLKFNIEFLLFKGPWSPFNHWHIKEDYKRFSRRKELTADLRKKFLLLGLLNLLLMPLLFFWQVLFFVFQYVELVKREPASMGLRKWNVYGRLYLRHLNELDHELTARLSRAYSASRHYMDIFVSPVSVEISRLFCFFAGAILTCLIILTCWDEDVLNVEHVITIMSVCGVVIAGCRAFIPDENIILCPEKMLATIVAHIHYFPVVNWKGYAHTQLVRNKLNDLFPYTMMQLFHELISPLVTPFLLIFHLRSYAAAEIIDFFRNFTVEVVGVGDVCSFAEMDIRRHGSPHLQTSVDLSTQPAAQEQDDASNTAAPLLPQDGKTEMSLINFALTNPTWKPSLECEAYLATLKSQTGREEDEQVGTEALHSSLNSLYQVGGIYSSLALGLLGRMRYPVPSPPPPIGLSSCATGDCVSSLIDSSCKGSEFKAADMSLSALYLHELRKRRYNGSHQISQGADEYRRFYSAHGEEDKSEWQPLLR